MNTTPTTAAQPEPRKIQEAIAGSVRLRRRIHEQIKAESEARKAATIAALPADFMDDWK